MVSINLENFKNIIPLGLLLPFLIIIGGEFLVSYGLNFYNQRLDLQIKNLESFLNQKQESLLGTLDTDKSFQVFSQTVNLVEILNRRRSLSFTINKFNQLMPKFIIIKDFNYDSDKNTIGISGLANDWSDYVRFHHYVSNLKDLKLESFTSPSLDEKNLVNFSMVFILNPSFYQQ